MEIKPLTWAFLSRSHLSQLSVLGRGSPGSHSYTSLVGNDFFTKVTGNSINKTTKPKQNVSEVLLAGSPKC